MNPPAKAGFRLTPYTAISAVGGFSERTRIPRLLTALIAVTCCDADRVANTTDDAGTVPVAVIMPGPEISNMTSVAESFARNSVSVGGTGLARF